MKAKRIRHMVHRNAIISHHYGCSGKEDGKQQTGVQVRSEN
jgi:hypothetical protein